MREDGGDLKSSDESLSLNISSVELLAKFLYALPGYFQIAELDLETEVWSNGQQKLEVKNTSAPLSLNDLFTTIIKVIPRVYAGESFKFISGSFRNRIDPETKKARVFFTVSIQLSEPRTVLKHSIPLDEFIHVNDKLMSLIQEMNFLLDNSDKFNTLTKREVEVLELIAAGSTNPDVAEKLTISRRTVEQHRKNINKKLGFKNYNDLYRFVRAFDLT